MMRFDLGTVLSITTDRLLTDMDNVYKILDYMTGDSLFTHQLDRASDRCKRPLLAQFPQLTDVEVPENLGGEEAWLTSQIDVYGNEFDVEPLESWKHIDPLTELAAMTDKPTIVVVPEYRP